MRDSGDVLWLSVITEPLHFLMGWDYSTLPPCRLTQGAESCHCRLPAVLADLEHRAVQHFDFRGGHSLYVVKVHEKGLVHPQETAIHGSHLLFHFVQFSIELIR